MKKKKKNEVAVGVTVLAVMILTIFIVVTLADWYTLLTSQQKVTVKLPYKDGLKGLIKGSPVFLGGVKIGTISDTGILDDDTSASENNKIFASKDIRKYICNNELILLGDETGSHALPSRGWGAWDKS